MPEFVKEEFQNWHVSSLAQSTKVTLAGKRFSLGCEIARFHLFLIGYFSGELDVKKKRCRIYI
jgi:hypothetical protein